MKTIAIIGTGESSTLYKKVDGVESIGVNDCWKITETDYLLSVDSIRAFTRERLYTIAYSKPKKFFSYIPEWEMLFTNNFELIKLNPKRSDVSTLGTELLPYSICSPYVAVCLAFNMGATEIIMYGVDFNSHKTLSIREKLDRIEKDFKELNKVLLQKGCRLYVASKDSYLSRILPVYEGSSCLHR